MAWVKEMGIVGPSGEGSAIFGLVFGHQVSLETNANSALTF
jgi:hypothetical protein